MPFPPFSGGFSGSSLREFWKVVDKAQARLGLPQAGSRNIDYVRFAQRTFVGNGQNILLDVKASSGCWSRIGRSSRRY